MKSKSIVTKDWLRNKVRDNPSHTIGRALVAIFRRQVASEQAQNKTRLKNNVGFSANDARIGSLGAKSFLKNGKLEDWQLKPWLKEVNGYPRICKYVKQLNDIANMKELNPT